MPNKSVQIDPPDLATPIPIRSRLRVRGSASVTKNALMPSGPATDAATVETYTRDIIQACIDLIDLPHDHDAQQRVIQLLQYHAPAAEQARARLSLARLGRQ